MNKYEWILVGSLTAAGGLLGVYLLKEMTTHKNSMPEIPFVQTVQEPQRDYGLPIEVSEIKAPVELRQDLVDIVQEDLQTIQFTDEIVQRAKESGLQQEELRLAREAYKEEMIMKYRNDPLFQLSLPELEAMWAKLNKELGDMWESIGGQLDGEMQYDSGPIDIDDMQWEPGEDAVKTFAHIGPIGDKPAEVRVYTIRLGAFPEYFKKLEEKDHLREWYLFKRRTQDGYYSE